MKWYQTLCIACGIAFLVPSFASAQPVPPPPPGQPGMMAPGKPGAHNNGKKPDNKKDDKNAHGPQGPAGHGPQGPAGHGPAKPAPMSPAPKPPVSPAHPAPHGPAIPPPPAPHNPMTHGMHPNDFDNLVHSIKRANFKADKLSRIKAAARSNHFTSRQVKELMQALDFDNDRVEAACALYPRVIDHNNWFMVFDALAFSSNRHRVEACSR